MSTIIPFIDWSHAFASGTQLNGQVWISLQDENGNPINGNNIIIYYDQVISGVTYHGSATIPGQGVGIYSGLLRDSATGFYPTWTITGQSAVPDPSPPVNQCDVLIRSFTNTNESFIGANDATLTVNATTSYGPLQYSLDNITFQLSNTFTGLSGGVKTVWVKDANPLGCITNQSVTIQVTANLLTTDPSVSLAGGNKSRWNAAFNNIIFKYQRKDFEVSAASAYIETLSLITITGTTFTVNGDLTILANLVTAFRAQGVNGTPLYVYINTPAYKGTFKVLNCTTSTVSCDIPFTATSTGFINSDSIKPYYKVYTKIAYNDPITGQPTTVLSKNSGDATGLIKADYKSFLQSLLQVKDDSQYNLVNFRDSNLSASYQISYAEHWEDGTVNQDGTTGHTGDFISLADTFYVTYTARQLGDKYGGNMAEFVPFRNLAASKWVTDFKTPVYSLSYPFDLSFIYGENLAGLALYSKITLLNINQGSIGSGGTTNTFLLNEDGSFLTTEDGSRFIIGEQSFFNQPIVEHVGLNRLLIDSDFDDDVYFIKVGIFYDATPGNDATAVQVMADQIVRIDKNCDQNSVYLRWIGVTGSWNYYRFVFNQEHTLDVQNSKLITQYVKDWENQTAIEKVISKSASEKITVHAEDMSVDDILGCQSMKFSPEVQICVQQFPPKWKTVIVNTATFAEYETNMGVYPFAVTFNMPSKNIQVQ